MLDGFREYLIGQGMALRTITAYTSYLRRCLVFCEDRGWDLRTLTPMQVAELAEAWPFSASGRRALRVTLGHYWDSQDRPINDQPRKAVRVPRRSRMYCRALDPDDAALLAKTARGWFPQGTAVLLGLYLALRREEIARARWDGFDRDFGWYTLTGAKGGQVATLPVHGLLADELRNRVTAFVYVFPGARGRAHVDPATIWNWTQEVALEAGISEIGVHQLRHTALATANDVTGDLRSVQTFARHADPATTSGYTRTTNTRLRAVVDALDYS